LPDGALCITNSGFPTTKKHLKAHAPKKLKPPDPFKPTVAKVGSVPKSPVAKPVLKKPSWPRTI
jgi:hypothetical protein